jgi:hypothetical protein
MKQQQTTEYDSDVEKVLQAYITHMNIANWAEAIDAANELTEQDCEVCESFGNHLVGIAVSVAECPTPAVRSDLVGAGIESATHIKDEIVDA